MTSLQILRILVRKHKLAKATRGSIIAGIVVLRNLVTATAVAGTYIIAFIASVGLIMGFVGLVRAFIGSGWGSGILGVLSIVIAVILFANVV